MNCPLGKCHNPDCPNYDVCLSESRLMNSRAIASETTLKKQRAKDRSQEITGTYVGYDQITGTHLIESEGGILPAKDGSASFKHPGQIVSGYIPYKSSIVHI
jgi:hypothetical protein